MNDKRVVEEIVTHFLLNTCRLRSRRLSRPAVQAAMSSAVLACAHPASEAEVNYIPLKTGSSAEFYIEPMLPHIGDVDTMFHENSDLAIPRGHPPPTQLPAEFHNYVKVVEIIDKLPGIANSHFPGYVYLELRYLLTEFVNDGKYKYNAVEYERQMYKPNVFYVDRTAGDIHGPAFATVHAFVLPSDVVHCVRCLVWPSEAADWPTRPRNYGWPDSATVDRVISNGCDVVGAVHRQCRQRAVISQYQWRLSFSRAEITLINSWTPVQQIIYHMLRVFSKSERLTDSGDNTEAGTLSNYHIKTLMLWACEQKPISWWTDDFSLVRICVELLHDLAAWLTEARCQHYFISNCNLVDSSFNLEVIRCRLMSISKSSLSLCFMNKYIRECSRLCPHSVARLFDEASSLTKLQNAVSEIIDWELKNDKLIDCWYAFFDAYYSISFSAYFQSLTVRSLNFWFIELRKISESLQFYLLSVVFLHVACRMSRNGLNDELMDVLAVIVGQSIGPRRYSDQCRSVLSLSKAANLMKAVADRSHSKSRSAVQLIEIELSRAYLHLALRCEDSDSNSIYCLANIYLAVLYYTTGQYQTAIDYCTQVMRSQDHSQCNSHVVQGEILPKTDDDIDIVLGLVVFYQHLRTAALNQHQIYVTVFTTELFAHYLYIKCLSVTKCRQLSDTANSQSSTYDVRVYVKRITDTQQLFVADALLWKLVNSFCGHAHVCKQQSRLTGCQYSTRYSCELSTADPVELLKKFAVEHLSTFRVIEARDFGSVVTIVTTDFEAMYAYKRGDYEQCLQLSTQNVHTLLLAQRMTNMPMLPEFIQLLDDDIVSLTALTLIVNPKCRDYAFGSCYFCITQLTLSLYLMFQCQMKLRHPSLADMLEYIEVAYKRLPVKRTIDRLTLKMIAHKAVTCITNQRRSSHSLND